MAAKIVLTIEGWTIHPGVLSQICTDFDATLFEAPLKDY